MQGRGKVAFLGVIAAVLITILMGLGIWQVQRLGWKNDLIARTEAQLNAPVSPAPAPDAWNDLDALDEYRRIVVSGKYQPEKDILVQAVTQYGGGFWVMTPLQTSEGWSVWVNRGFVPRDRREAKDRVFPDGRENISGLLRMSQPNGAFLRTNQPAENRWYSRDVKAMSQTHNLTNVASYFIDAERRGEGLPIGGLTIVQFRNSHLSYALTWFVMALGLAIASFTLLRREWRQKS